MSGQMDVQELKRIIEKKCLGPVQDALYHLDGSKNNPATVGLAQRLALAINADPSDDDRESDQVKETRRLILVTLKNVVSWLESAEQTIKQNGAWKELSEWVRELARQHLAVIRSFREDFYLRTQARTELDNLVSKLEKLATSKK